MNEYSKINSPILKKFKKINKKTPTMITDYLTYLGQGSIGLNMENVNLQNIDQRDIFVEIHKLLHAIPFLKKVYLNYYIESKDIADFFTTTKIKKESEKNIKDIIRKKSILLEDKNYKMDSFSGFIFTKTLQRTISFNIITQLKNNEEHSQILISDGDTFRVCDLDSILLKQKVFQENTFVSVSESEDDSHIKCTYIRLLLNMLFYMEAFPNKILNTPPNEVSDKLNKHNSKTIETHKTIASYLKENQDISPHLRRGHFRYLSDDRYINKKGQFVFVNPSFVKGQAKTIIK